MKRGTASEESSFDMERDVARKHLGLLRKLLAAEVFQQPDLYRALHTIASMIKQALKAREAMVTLWNAKTSEWSAVTSLGMQLEQRGVSVYGSRTVLDRSRALLAPVLTSSSISMDDLRLASESIQEIKVSGVLAVPFFQWDLAGSETEQQFAGCLYAHRIAGEAPFTDDDTALLSDIAALVQPNINLLHHMNALELRLEATQEEVHHLRRAAADHNRLLRTYSQDQAFHQSVILPLQRVSQADRIGLMLLGPTGSGKSHLARCYHYDCPRKHGPFVVLDCSQVTSAETLTAELFGYAPLSGYANAPQKGRLGKAQLADKGTLFIDEIACLPLPLQQKLLRLIETGTFSPLGSSKESQVDIQIIAATNENLAELVQQRSFREDLFWRLSELTLTIPPLSQRQADIPSLARHCLQEACRRYQHLDVFELSDDAMAALCAFPWDQAGNIRGLGNTLNRTVLMAPAGVRTLTQEHIQFQETLAGLSTPSRSYPSVSSATAWPSPTSSPASTMMPTLPTASLPIDDEDDDAGPQVAPDASLEERRSFLAEKIRAYAGTITEMTLDPGVAHVLGYQDVPVPYSSLRLKLRDAGLTALVKEERERHKGTHLTSEALQQAVRQHRTGSAAAEALGITRAALVWRLRKDGHSIRSLLEG